jgi:hypothetical protein
MLQQKHDKRPSCDQLINSPIFAHYSDKLKKSGVTDEDFLTTIKTSTSTPGLTNQLLKTIYIPKDLSGLSKMLPRTNYTSCK